MNRPRKQDRRHWPDYLNGRKKAGGIYYSWKHPETGKEFGLGYVFADAANQARQANLALLAEKSPKATLADRISGASLKTIDEWLDVFKGVLDRRPSKKNGGGSRAETTRAKDDKFIAVMRDHFDGAVISKITTQECHALVQKYLDADQERTAAAYRSFLIDCFKEAESAGWIPRGTNPAEIIKAPKPKTKRSRLSLESFKTVLDNSEGWARTSLLLALVTGQRESDIAAMEYDHVREGFLHVQQIKTGHRIRIPVELQLLGHSIRSIIKQSRGIVGAKHIVHQTVSTGRSKPGAGIRKESIGREFTKLLRAHVKPDWNGTPPTFHEIRALSKKMHQENGIDTLELLGHDSEETGRIYSDPRGGWVEVKLPKSA